MYVNRYIKIVLLISFGFIANCQNAKNSFIKDNQTKKSRSRKINFNHEYSRETSSNSNDNSEIKCARCKCIIDNAFDYCLKCGWQHVWLGEGTMKILPGPFGHD